MLSSQHSSLGYDSFLKVFSHPILCDYIIIKAPQCKVSLYNLVKIQELLVQIWPKIIKKIDVINISILSNS